MTNLTASVTVEENDLRGREFETVDLDQKYQKQEDYIENVGIVKFHVHQGETTVLVLLGVFWTQTSALTTYVLHEPNKNYVTGTMTIDSENDVADVHVRSGVYSSDTIFDYGRGYIATRLFSRRACFIMKIDKQYIPTLQQIGRLAFERQTMKEIYSSKNVWVQFQSGHSFFGNIKNWLTYGKPIEKLCKGLPLYRLVKSQPPLNVRGCANAGVPNILGIQICEKSQ